MSCLALSLRKEVLLLNSTSISVPLNLTLKSILTILFSAFHSTGLLLILGSKQLNSTYILTVKSITYKLAQTFELGCVVCLLTHNVIQIQLVR